ENQQLALVVDKLAAIGNRHLLERARRRYQGRLRGHIEAVDQVGAVGNDLRSGEHRLKIGGRGQILLLKPVLAVEQKLLPAVARYRRYLPAAADEMQSLLIEAIRPQLLKDRRRRLGVENTLLFPAGNILQRRQHDVRQVKRRRGGRRRDQIGQQLRRHRDQLDADLMPGSERVDQLAQRSLVAGGRLLHPER